MRFPWRRRRKRTFENPFANKENLFLFLGEVAVQTVNGELTEHESELCLNAVAKYFHGMQIYKAMDEADKKTVEPAVTKADIDSLKTEVAALSKRFSDALDPKVNRGMWG